ncbi:malto-oligosyltrehalose synthase [Euzebya sp.]|uniref:malto-oligosyltrehalose synthase n=1 Tax=Euzebya sp. TaxID=1971409 RepID=UPI0035152E5B
MPTPTPSSTYRLHLTHAFTLADAVDLVDHVDALGVDWLYLSPIQKVPTGAGHGYHILDPDVVDPQLGGEQALRELAAALAARDRGMILDIVPNHLAASPDNAWWDDLLRHGPASAHAGTFDVDLGEEGMRRPIVLPVLGAPLTDVLAAGDVRVEGDRLAVYDDLSLPLAPGTDPDAPIEAVLEAQHYRLAHWLTGERELTYRRFFAVNDLVGVRVEDPQVFDAIHTLVLRLVEDDVVQGLRVDHIDGLADPAAYLRRLRERIGDDRWLLVEKILELDEDLPDWPVEGTTGYEVAALLNLWLTDVEGYRRLRAEFETRTGLTGPVVHALAESKWHVLQELFAADVDAVQRLLGPVDGVDDHDVGHVLGDMAAHLRGYRTYVPVEGSVALVDERAIADAADAAAVTHGRHVASAVVDALTGQPGRRALTRWQQLTGPAAAKGFEDRLLYRHVSLSSLCEVGIDAASLDQPPEPPAIVEGLAARQAAWPDAGTTTSTHDTKRAEDVRARIAVLAEVPDAFLDLLAQLDDAVDDPPAAGATGQPAAGATGQPTAGATGQPAAGAVDEHARWLLAQTAVGVIGLCADDPGELTERLAAYAHKALREAEVRTSHRDPDEAYEQAVADWVAAITTREDAVAPLSRLAGRIAVPGAVNALSTVLLKIAGPGVPDIYRGTEIWDDSLVDPDNRRPLPLDRIRAARERVEQVLAADDRAAAVAGLRDDWRDGALKMLVTRTGLELRRRHAEVFARGSLEGVHADGSAADHVAALRRGSSAQGTGPDGTTVLAVATRLPYGLARDRWPVADVWGDTTIATSGHRRLTDALTGAVHEPVDGRLRLDGVLATLPVAMLVGHDHD